MADIFMNDTRTSSQPARSKLDARIPDPIGLLSDVTASISLFLARLERRRRFRALLAYDDRTLDDMGVTRHEIERAAGLPLHVNAAVEVHRVARLRREQDHRPRRR